MLNEPKINFMTFEVRGILVEAYFQELKRYTIGEIREKLRPTAVESKPTEEELMNIIRRLKECQILKAVNSSYSDQNISVNNTDEIIGDNFGEDVHFVFDYVGIAVLGDYVFKCYPKYFREKEPIQQVQKKVKDEKDEFKEKFEEVIQVIEKYNKTHTKRKRTLNLTDGRGGIITNEIALKIFLLREYYQRGIYKKERVTIEDNGAGEILWEETLETPGFYKNGFVFHIPLKTVRSEDDENYFTDLHRCVLTEITKEFYKNGLLDLFNISPIFLSNLPLDRFDRKEHILKMLKREQRVQFVTWKQNLLRALYAYIGHARTDTISDRVELFGTNCFNLVWEDVCRCVFDDQLDCKLKDLPGFVKRNSLVDSNKKFAEVIEHPVWRSTISEEEFASVGTFKPDIIGIYRNANVNDSRPYKLWIFDAKYYNILFDNDKQVKNQPGVEDVAKQYLYELVLRNLLLKNFSDPYKYDIVHNVFLCPSDSGETKVLGIASIESLKNLIEIKLENINIVKINANNLYKIYLHREKKESRETIIKYLRKDLEKA